MLEINIAIDTLSKLSPVYDIRKNGAINANTLYEEAYLTNLFYNLAFGPSYR